MEEEEPVQETQRQRERERASRVRVDTVVDIGSCKRNGPSLVWFEWTEREGDKTWPIGRPTQVKKRRRRKGESCVSE